MATHIKVQNVKSNRVKNFAHFYVKGSRVFERNDHVLVSIADDTNPTDARQLVTRLIQKANATIQIAQQ